MPDFSNEEKRKTALRKYHGCIIRKAILDGYEELAGLELEALKSGLYKIGDFKRDEKMFEEEMKQAGFSIAVKNKIGPLDNNHVGGFYVYIFKKPTH